MAGYNGYALNKIYCHMHFAYDKRPTINKKVILKDALLIFSRLAFGDVYFLKILQIADLLFYCNKASNLENAHFFHSLANLTRQNM